MATASLVFEHIHIISEDPAIVRRLVCGYARR